ncbi:MAG: MFS transporter, partial [Burkholderiales bacterium]
MSIVTRTSIAKLIETSPLRHASFRRFYIGATGSAIGYTMQATIAAWLMATLTPSTLMVALVQTASTGPALVIGLVAGALADKVDRRKIILYAQIILLLAAVMLGASTSTGTIGPGTLLALTFVIGAAFTLYLPAQQASVNDLVSRPDLPRALALGAVSFNIARAIGPALAGGLAAWLGAGPAMFAAGLFFVPMFFAALGGKARERVLPGLPESISSGVLAGLRFARHSEPIRAMLFRTFTFCLSASAFWSL